MPELVEEAPRALGTEARAAPVIATSPGGKRARSFTAAGISPVSIRSVIFCSSVAPIPGSSVTRPSRVSAATDTRRVAHDLRGVAVGDHAVDDRAVELVEVAELVERVRDRAVGWRRPRPLG